MNKQEIENQIKLIQFGLLHFDVLSYEPDLKHNLDYYKEQKAKLSEEILELEKKLEEFS